MDKYDKILDLVEHPNKYASEEVHELLSDQEMKEIYRLLSDTATALHAEQLVSEEYLNHEWERINTDVGGNPRMLNSFKLHVFPFSRAVSVIAIILSSLVALAVGISISVTMSDKKTKGDVSENPSQDLTQAVSNYDTISSSDNGINVEMDPVIFEDMPLEEILKAVSDHYNISVKFQNPDKAGIHMFYKFDTRKSLEDIVEQLNTFERITISIEGDSIIVE
ncbi:MAG: DUF4974 domain-containing protein [Muribaculaceae bacterium]|nr:DUF4974 domain-containing protein [Muribaculaceae bacterium]